MACPEVLGQGREVQMIRSSFVSTLLVLSIPGMAASEDQSPWEFTGAAGLSVSDGNSDSVAYSLQFLGSYLKDGREAYFGADYFFAEDRGVESTHNFKLFAQYNHDLDEQWYLGARGSYFHDRVADIDYRMDGGLLVGLRVIDQERMNLRFELGPGYAWQKQGRIQNDFVTLRLAQSFEYKFSKTTRFWQSLAWTPRVEDFSDSLLEIEAGLETRVTEQLALRSFLRHRFDSEPSLGSGRSDTSLLFGVAYDLGGHGEAEEESSGRRSLMPDEEASAETKDGWSSTAALGFSLNQGNSDRIGYHMDWSSAYRSPEHEFFFDLGYHYSEDNGATSTDRLTSRLQYNRRFDSPCYVGGLIGFLRDEPAAIEYRVVPGLLAGYSLIDTGDTSLALEIGPSYTFEKLGGVAADFASMVASERFSHAFNERFELKQAVVFTAELADFGNSSVSLSAALDTRMTQRLIWRLGASYTYENRPAVNRQRHDTLFSGSIATKF